MSDQPGVQKSAVDQQKVIGNEKVVQTETEKEKTDALGDLSRPVDKNRLTMRIKIYSPFKNYFDDQAFSISAENTTGPFDILPRHHNFISLLMPCELIVRSVGDEDKHIRISGGIMHVKADHVIVFLDV